MTHAQDLMGSPVGQSNFPRRASTKNVSYQDTNPTAGPFPLWPLAAIVFAVGTALASAPAVARKGDDHDRRQEAHAFGKLPVALKQH